MIDKIRGENIVIIVRTCGTECRPRKQSNSVNVNDLFERSRGFPLLSPCTSTKPEMAINRSISSYAKVLSFVEEKGVDKMAGAREKSGTCWGRRKSHFTCTAL
jgi:hypothetical protein